MTIETLRPNGSTVGWTSGDHNDVNDDSDATFLNETGTVEEVVTTLDLGASVITDADTVNGVDIRVRANRTGSGNDLYRVALLIGGTSQGEEDQPLNSTITTRTHSAVGTWDSDWTASEIDGMQVRLTAGQTQKAQNMSIRVHEVWVDIDYTAAGGGLSIPVAMNSYRQRHQFSMG